MNILRRDLLKGTLGACSMVIGSNMLPGFSWAMAPPADMRKLVVLSHGANQGARFAAGVVSTVTSQGLSSPLMINLNEEKLGDISYLHKLLRGLRGRRLFGLMEEARYVPISALVQTVGAKLLYEGVHSQYGSETVRHSLQVTELFSSVGERFAKGLTASTERVEVTERPFFLKDNPKTASSQILHNTNQTAQGCWAECIGRTLTRVESNPKAQPGGMPRAFFKGRNVYANESRMAAMVSFVVDL